MMLAAYGPKCYHNLAMSTEKEAAFRRGGRIASGVTIALALIALVLAFRGDQTPASVVLALALVSLAVTWLSYRRYQSLRDNRWQQELARTEAEMSSLLNPEEDAQSMGSRDKKEGPAPDQAEETEVAGR